MKSCRFAYHIGALILVEILYAAAKNLNGLMWKVPPDPDTKSKHQWIIPMFFVRDKKSNAMNVGFREDILRPNTVYSSSSSERSIRVGTTFSRKNVMATPSQFRII